MTMDAHVGARHRHRPSGYRCRALHAVLPRRRRAQKRHAHVGCKGRSSKACLHRQKIIATSVRRRPARRARRRGPGQHAGGQRAGCCRGRRDVGRQGGAACGCWGGCRFGIVYGLAKAARPPSGTPSPQPATAPRPPLRRPDRHPLSLPARCPPPVGPPAACYRCACCPSPYLRLVASRSPSIAWCCHPPSPSPSPCEERNLRIESGMQRPSRRRPPIPPRQSKPAGPTRTCSGQRWRRLLRRPSPLRRHGNDRGSSIRTGACGIAVAGQCEVAGAWWPKLICQQVHTKPRGHRFASQL